MERHFARSCLALRIQSVCLLPSHTLQSRESKLRPAGHPENCRVTPGSIAAYRATDCYDCILTTPRRFAKDALREYRRPTVGSGPIAESQIEPDTQPKREVPESILTCVSPPSSDFHHGTRPKGKSGKVAVRRELVSPKCVQDKPAIVTQSAALARFYAPAEHRSTPVEPAYDLFSSAE